MRNVELIEFDIKPSVTGADKGGLVAVEGGQSIPFDIERVYYIYGVPEGVRRGYHSHRELNQALICVNGSISIHTRTPFESEEWVLDSPQKALLVGPMVWREMYDFSPGSALVVLADQHYSEADYIRDYDEYAALAEPYFEKETK